STVPPAALLTELAARTRHLPASQRPVIITGQHPALAPSNSQLDIIEIHGPARSGGRGLLTADGGFHLRRPDATTTPPLPLAPPPPAPRSPPGPPGPRPRPNRGPPAKASRWHGPRRRPPARTTCQPPREGHWPPTRHGPPPATPASTTSPTSGSTSPHAAPPH